MPGDSSPAVVKTEQQPLKERTLPTGSNRMSALGWLSQVEGYTSVKSRLYFFHLPFAWNRSVTKLSSLWRMLFLFQDFIFRERGKEGEREGNITVWLPLTWPPLGTWPATQACALIGNRTSYPLVHRPTLNPLSHTSQGWRMLLLDWLIKRHYLVCYWLVKYYYKL